LIVDDDARPPGALNELARVFVNAKKGNAGVQENAGVFRC
jgi:hypothetical protein